MWIEAPLPDGSVGGGVWTLRWPDNKSTSVYLSAWFNTLRTSYGMALYARRTKNDELLRLAQQTLNLAPQDAGQGRRFQVRRCALRPRVSPPAGALATARSLASPTASSATT